MPNEKTSACKDTPSRGMGMNSVAEKYLSNGESKHGSSTAELNETDNKIDVCKPGVSRATCTDVVVVPGTSSKPTMEKTAVTCTACQTVVKARKLYSHPKLKVLLCQACFYGYKHTKFVISDGTHVGVCCWCGKGGEMICCDYCSGAFHTKCIIQNVSKEYYDQISSYDKWACFICDSVPIKKARDLCEQYKDYLIDLRERDSGNVQKRGRKPFLSPTEKMPPKVALVRCLQNSYFSARDLKDAMVELQGRVNNISTSADVEIIGQSIKASLLEANEKHLEIIKAVDCLLAKVRQPREVSATIKASASNNDFAVADSNKSAEEELSLVDGEVTTSPTPEQQQTCASGSVTNDIIRADDQSLHNSDEGSRERRNVVSDEDKTVSRKNTKHENPSKRAASDLKNLKSSAEIERPDSDKVDTINVKMETKGEEAITTSASGNTTDTDEKSTEMDVNLWGSSDDKSELENNEKEDLVKKKVSQKQKTQKPKVSDDECNSLVDESVPMKPKKKISKKFVNDGSTDDDEPKEKSLETRDGDLESAGVKNLVTATSRSKKKRVKDVDIQSSDSVDSEPDANEEIELKPQENKDQMTDEDETEPEMKDNKKAKQKSTDKQRSRADSKLKRESNEKQSSDDTEAESDMKDDKKIHLKSKPKLKTKGGKSLKPESDEMPSSDDDLLTEMKDDVKNKSKSNKKLKAKADKSLKPESDEIQSSDANLLTEMKDDVKNKSKSNKKLKAKADKSLKPESDEMQSSDDDLLPEMKDDVKDKSKGNEKQKAKVDKSLKTGSDEQHSSEYETAPEMKQKGKKTKSKSNVKLNTKASIKLKGEIDEVQSSEDDANEKKVEPKSEDSENSSKDESESEKKVTKRINDDTPKTREEKQKPKGEPKHKLKESNKHQLNSEELVVKTSDEEMQELEEDLGKEMKDEEKPKTPHKRRLTAKDDELGKIDKQKENEDQNEELEVDKNDEKKGKAGVDENQNSADVKDDIEDDINILKLEPMTDIEDNVSHHWQNEAENLENEIEAVISVDDREKSKLRCEERNRFSGSISFELPKVGSATDSDSDEVKPTTSKDSWKIESQTPSRDVEPCVETTPGNDDDKPKSALRLSLKKVSPKDDEKSSKPDDIDVNERKNSRFRGLKFSSDSDTSDDSKNVKSVVMKIENDLLEDKKLDDGEEECAVDVATASPVDDSDVKAKKELLKMLDDSDTDELATPLVKRKKDTKRNKLKLAKPQPAKNDTDDETKVTKKSTVTSNSHLSKRNKLQRLLKESDDSLPSLDSKSNSGKRAVKKQSSSAGPTTITDYKTLLQDRKLKMKAQVVLMRMSNEEIEFILEDGYKAWKKRQKRQKSNALINSSDEEFVRMCDLGTLRRKNKSSSRAEKTVTDASEDSEDCSKGKDKKKKSKGKGIKQSNDDLHLSAVNSSDSSKSDQSEEENGDRVRKKPVVSSDSEPVFKSANELAKERLLKDLASSDDEDEDKSSDDDDDLIKSSDNDSVRSDGRKKKKKRKAVSGSGEDSKSNKKRGSDDDDDDDLIKKKEAKRKKRKVASGSDTSDSKATKKYDSDDDFVPVNKGRRLRSKVSLNSDSDSNDSIATTKRKRTRGKDSDTGKVSTSSATSIGSRKRKRGKDGKSGGKKRRRRIRMASSSDSSVEEVSASEDLQATPSGKGRKNIRKLISDRKLTTDTKVATREEDERRKRVADLQKLYNEAYDQESKTGTRITTKLVLATDTTTNETLEINEGLICKLKPHQVEGVKFMWECIGESLERLDTTPGSGCILAHCMGLGKTLQVIAFLHTILTREKENPKTALVVCPLNTVLNWHRECETWLEDVYPSIIILEMSRVKHYRDRLMVLKNWSKHGGILIMGYDNFRIMVQENSKRIPKFYRELFQTLLVNPGPDVVVCDEGHILKNLNTGISKAMSRINTKRRIILTGTPLQNNLTEYHCMVNFVKPSLLGTLKEFQNRFVNPIYNGQHTDSTPFDVRIMKSRAHILHNLLDGCVQRRDYNVLTPFLPPKYEYVISVRLSEIQIQLYSYYINNLCSRLHGKGHLFGDYQCLMRIWTHPRVIRLAEIRQETKMLRLKALKEKLSVAEDGLMAKPEVIALPKLANANNESHDSFIDDNTDSSSSESKNSVILEDSDEPGTSKKSNHESDTEVVVNNWKTRSRSEKMPENEVKVLDKDEPSDEPLNTWWSTIISEDEAKKIEHSGKMMVLFEILRQCDEIGDKVLLFSQSLLSLDYIESIITGDEDVEGAELHPFVGKMVRGVDYFRLDGSTSADSRSKFIRSFNDKESLRARLFLISTKAGSLGINLVAANRVVIFDASWNPTHDIQSIFRVYRFGQTKPVYIYRLVAHGTMEEKIYDRQVTKQSLACRVIDEQQIERHFSFADLQELYLFDPESVRNRPTPMVPKDKLLAELLIKRKDLIMSYHEHDSLLVNQAEEELTEEERRAAWVEYECERKALAAEVGMKVDVHATIQNIQRQNPGISIPELTAKINEIFKTMANELREKRIQQQKLLLQQQQQRLQQQMQFAPQLNYAYQNQAQDIFGQRHLGQLDLNRQFHGLGQMAMNPKPHLINPAFAKVASLPPDKPFQ